MIIGTDFSTYPHTHYGFFHPVIFKIFISRFSRRSSSSSYPSVSTLFFSASSYFILSINSFFVIFLPVLTFFPVRCHLDLIYYILLPFPPSGPTFGFFHKTFLCTLQVQTLFFHTSANGVLFHWMFLRSFHNSPYLIFPSVFLCFVQHIFDTYFPISAPEAFCNTLDLH